MSRDNSGNSNSNDLFVPAGRVAWAQMLDYPPRFISEGRVRSNGNGRASNSNYTRQQREGLRYERRALMYLQELADTRASKDYILLANSWFMFKSESNSNSNSNSNNNPRFCQTDGLLFNSTEKKIILVEIKLQHTNAAWRQIRLLYEPVLKVIYPEYSIAAIELCKWLDPHSSFPEQYFYAEDVFSAAPDKFGVHLYKPGRERKPRNTKKQKRSEV